MAKNEIVELFNTMENIGFRTIMIILFISPIGYFSNIRKMWMTILNTCIKYGYMNTGT
jgi:hypothetical protein